MINHSYQLIYRRLNARFQPATLARHETRLAAAIAARINARKREA